MYKFYRRSTTYASPNLRFLFLRSGDSVVVGTPGFDFTIGAAATGACVIAGLGVAVASGLVGTTVGGGTAFGSGAGIPAGGLTGGAQTAGGGTITAGDATGGAVAALGEGFSDEETMLLGAGIKAGTTFGVGGKGSSGVLVCERGIGVGGAVIPLAKMG